MKNPVAKHAHKFNRAAIHKDKTKYSRGGDIAIPNKVITITEDVWWDNPGCDCCESIPMPFFTSPDLDYTPTSEAECLTNIIQQNTDNYTDDFLYNLSTQELQAILDNLNIEVIFNYLETYE